MMIIWSSFLVALLLQIMPLPDYILAFRPDWVMIVLIYWTIILSHRLSVSINFIMGIILDLINGFTLGVHSLSMSIITYLLVFKLRLFHNLALWQQAVLVVILSVITDIIIFLTEFFLINVSFHPEIFLSSLINGILWPWLSSLMRRISQRFNLY